MSFCISETDQEGNIDDDDVKTDQKVNIDDDDVKTYREGNIDDDDIKTDTLASEIFK